MSVCDAPLELRHAADDNELESSFTRVLSLLERLQGQPRIGSLALEICDDIIKHDVIHGGGGEDVNSRPGGHPTREARPRTRVAEAPLAVARRARRVVSEADAVHAALVLLPV